MITKNQKNSNITLVAILKDDIKNEYIKKDNNSFSFISEDKKYYFTAGVDENTKRNKFWILKDKLESFAEALKFNINVDIDSFVKIYGDAVVSVVVEQIAFGAREQYSLKKDSKKAIELNFNYDSKHEETVNHSLIKVEFQCFAGMLQDLPPNIGTSVKIAEMLEAKAKEVSGVKVTVLTKKEIEANKMGLLLSVNAGSNCEPRVVIFEYASDTSKEKIAFVGKGITFDSGGYNLKPSLSMVGMKMDMSGAAIALSSVLAIAKAGLKTNVVAVGVFTDNRIGRDATLTESIVTSMKGLTVQIDNTDAEGRLVLGDGLYYAATKLKADKIVDIATLTGAMQFSLGTYFTGMFSKNDEFANKVLAISEKSHEDIWRLPLDSRHEKAMETSKIADLSNVGDRNNGAGSSTAAGFLEHFVENVPYVHLDIAETEGMKKFRGNGVMLKTFFELAK